MSKKTVDTFFVILLLPFFLYWKGLVLCLGWGWFIAERWQLPTPPLPNMIGMFLMFDVLIMSVTKHKQKKDTSLAMSMIASMLAMGLVLLVMYVIYSIRNVQVVL